MKAIPIHHWTTKNGLRVFFVERHEIPMIEINLAFLAGSIFDNNKFGLSQLTNIMLNQGNDKYDTNQISDHFEKVGAQFFLTSNRDISLLKLHSMSAAPYLTRALSMLKTVLTEPGFSSLTLDRMKKMIMHAIQQQQQMPEMLAKNTFFSAVYGNHPYAHSVLGTRDSMAALMAEDVRQFYSRYYVANNAMLTIIGDLTVKKAHYYVNQIIDNLPEGEINKTLIKADIYPASINKHVVFPSEQTHILLGQIGVRMDDADHFPLLVGNMILGGSNTSRLFIKIREKYGLAYNIVSSIQSLLARGTIAVILQTHHQKANLTLEKVFNIIQDFVEKGPTKKEVMEAKKAIINGFPLSLARNDSISAYLLQIGEYHLPLNYIDTYCNQVNAVTIDKIKTAFQHYLPPNNLITIMTGR